MKSILIFIGVCFSAVAMASDWHLVYFDKDYNTMFYDRESVVKTKTNTTKAWIARVSYRDISIYNLTLAFMEVDKQKEQYRCIQSNAYKNGNLVHSKNKPTEWMQIIPGTNAVVLFDYIGDTRKSEIGHVNGSLNDLLSFGRMQADAKEVMDIYEQEIKRDSLNNEVNVNSSQNLAFPHCTPEYIRAYIRRFGRMPDDCPRSMNPLCKDPEYIRAYIRRFGRMPDDCPRSMNPLCKDPEYIRAYIRRFGRMPDDCSRSMN